MTADRRLLAIAAVLAVTAAGCAAGEARTQETIRQPSVGSLPALTRRRLGPDSTRVDLRVPTFSRPTQVTNPLFPIGRLHSAVIFGEVDGQPLKVETTLLPVTKTVDWHGMRIEALQSQFAAFLNGRITEVAVDLYAQADDGAVWYFGEDVVDYVNGRAATSDGTWLAGADGPPAMIMPAHPHVGDVYRTENVPGAAFEQVTVKRVGVTVLGPSGRVKDAMVGQELHTEGDLESKTFAPDRGEFFSGGGHDFEALALAVPADARPGPTPPALERVARGVDGMFDSVRSGDWPGAAASVETAIGSWTAFSTQVPHRLRGKMSAALDRLTKAVAARDGRMALQSALDSARAALDVQLRYRRPSAIDLGRFDVWLRQLLVDAGNADADALHGDVVTLAWILDRLAFTENDGNRIDDELRYLRSVADAKEFGVAIRHGMRLRKMLGAATLRSL